MNTRRIINELRKQGEFGTISPKSLVKNFNISKKRKHRKYNKLLNRFIHLEKRDLARINIHKTSHSFSYELYRIVII